MEYLIHEFANIYPPMGEEELKELAQSIKTNGLVEPIKLYEGKILDGRNRYWACQKAGVEPIYEQWQGTPYEAVIYICDQNEKRRHLTSSQRAACAVQRTELLQKIAASNENIRLANLKKGPDRQNPDKDGGSLRCIEVLENIRPPDIDKTGPEKSVKSSPFGLPKER